MKGDLRNRREHRSFFDEPKQKIPPADSVDWLFTVEKMLPRNHYYRPSDRITTSCRSCRCTYVSSYPPDFFCIVPVARSTERPVALSTQYGFGSNLATAAAASA